MCVCVCVCVCACVNPPLSHTQSPPLSHSLSPPLSHTQSIAPRAPPSAAPCPHVCAYRVRVVGRHLYGPGRAEVGVPCVDLRRVGQRTGKLGGHCLAGGGRDGPMGRGGVGGQGSQVPGGYRGRQFELQAGVQVKLQAGVQVELQAGVQVELQTGVQVELQTGVQVELQTGVQVELQTGGGMSKEACVHDRRRDLWENRET